MEAIVLAFLIVFVEFSKGLNSGQCSYFSGIAHGNVDIRSYEIGTVARVTCHPDFLLTGPEFITCGENGEWSKAGSCNLGCSFVPTLDRRVVLLNGTEIARETRLPVDSIIKMRCPEGQIAGYGYPITMCQSNLEWRPQLGTCVIMSDEHSKLAQAAADGDESALKHALTLDAIEVNWRDSQKIDECHPWPVKSGTPLHRAVDCGRSAATIVKPLLDAGADVNIAEETNHATPLHFAAVLGDASTLEHLLQYGANVDAVLKNGTSALWHAAEQGHAECVMKLLNRKASLTDRAEDGYTPLHMAAIRGHLEVVRVLLSRNKGFPDYINLKTAAGTTPLMEAVSNNHEAVAKELISRGADVNTRNGYGIKVIDLAEVRGLGSVVALIRQLGE